MAGEIKRADETLTLSGTTYGLMLADAGSLGGSSSSPFAPKLAQGERTYQDYSPASAIGFADLSGGIGQEWAKDLTQYHDANNVDARGGRTVLAPLITATPTTPPGLVAPEALSAPNLTAWMPVDVTYPAVACSFVPYAGVTKIRRVWLPLKGTVAAENFTVKIVADDAGAPDETDVKATGTVVAPTLRAGGSWVVCTFAAQATVVAGTTYWLVVSHSGPAGSGGWWGLWSAVLANSQFKDDGVWVENGLVTYLPFFYADDQLAPDGPLKYLLGAGADHITRLWGAYGRYAYYFGAAGTPTPVNDTHDGVNGGKPKVFAADLWDIIWFKGTADVDSRLYVSLGDGANMVSFDGTVGTEHWTDTGVTAEYLAVHGNQLWRAYSINRISASLDGTTWGNYITVGGYEYRIRSLISWNGYLWVGKDDGLYKIEFAPGYPTTGTPTATRAINLSTLADMNNFLLMVEHQGDLIFSCQQGLMRYTPGGVLTPISPETGLDLAASERSRYRSACSTPNALWVAAEGPPGGRTSILSYTEGHWHPVCSLPRYGDMVRSVVAEPGWYGDTERIWFNAGLQTSYIAMPLTTQRRWQWTGLDWAASGTLDLSWIDGGIRTIDKDWIRLRFDCDQVGAAADGYPHVHVSYRTAEGGALAVLGSVEATGVQTLTFPAATWGNKIQLRLTLERGTWPQYLAPSNIATPIVNAVVLEYMERPLDSQAFTATYDFSHGVWRNGVQRTASLAAQLAILRTLREAKEPLTYVNVIGQSNLVHMVDYNYSIVREGQRDVNGYDDGHIVASCRFQVI